MILIKKCALILLVLGLTQCQTQTEKPPIEQHKLELILADIHVAEARADNSPTRNRDSLTRQFYLQIFNKHGVTVEDFKNSMAYMGAHPEQMQKIYEKVILNIQQRDSILKTY